LDKQFPSHKRADGKKAFNTRRPEYGDSTIARSLVKKDEKLESYSDGYEKYAQLNLISFPPCMGFLTLFI